MDIDSWAKHRRVLASFIGLLVGTPFRTGLGETITQLHGLHKAQDAK